jgi:hypothetical protein
VAEVGDEGREGKDGVERLGVDVDERMRRWRRHAAARGGAAPATLAAFGIAGLGIGIALTVA